MPYFVFLDLPRHRVAGGPLLIYSDTFFVFRFAQSHGCGPFSICSDFCVFLDLPRHSVANLSFLTMTSFCFYICPVTGLQTFPY